jgi:AcrR family transcriptional regulator
MAGKKLEPSPELLLQIESTFLAHGYSALTMERLAEACHFSRRALYFYFSSKAEAFRAFILFRNQLAMRTGFAAGRRRWSDGGNALEILAEIINIRYGDTRRIANASKHVVELNAEVFTRCIDIVRDVALIFEADLAKLIIELQAANLIRLRADLTAEQLAQALCNGARGVNQRLPPISPQDLADRYRDMCRYILYGCAEMPAAQQRPRSTKKRR